MLTDRNFNQELDIEYRIADVDQRKLEETPLRSGLFLAGVWRRSISQPPVAATVRERVQGAGMVRALMTRLVSGPM